MQVVDREVGQLGGTLFSAADRAAVGDYLTLLRTGEFRGRPEVLECGEATLGALAAADNGVNNWILTAAAVGQAVTGNWPASGTDKRRIRTTCIL